MSSNVSYSYNASAIGLGGVIRKGRCTTVVPTVASVCLASAGGEASNSVENYCRDGISFSRAESRVAGYSGSGEGVRRHYTYADVFISNLQIFDRLKIALMQATVTSTRDIDSENASLELYPDRTRFSLRVIYRGIEIDGQEVVPDIDWDLCHAETYDNFTRLLKTRAHIPLEMQNLLGHGDGTALRTAAAPAGVIDAETAATEIIRRPQQPPRVDVPRDRPPVSGPLVNFRGNGNKLQVPKFGHAKFADVVVKPDRQRVSLLRLNLDSNWVPSLPAGEPRFSFAAHALTDSSPTFTVASNSEASDGDGGSVSSGDGGSNGVPIWT